MLQHLPLNTYTFRKIREGNALYIDKTRYLYDLVSEAGNVFFIARPRRFGKSLLTTTLSELLAGNRDLFTGLWIDQSPYSWPKHPVIRIDFSLVSAMARTVDELDRAISYQLDKIAAENNLTLTAFNASSRLDNLIKQLSERGNVALLIDEYDKPIIDQMGNPDEARHVQKILKQFYSVIKGADQYLHFVLITGISKFSRVGIFSGLNHLTDLTFRAEFGTMLGITEEEVRDNLDGHIQAFADKVGRPKADSYALIKQWYNGYRFVEGSETLYNPFSLFHVLDEKRVANFWFETGTPTFLIELIKEQQFDVRHLSEIKVPEIAFSTYDLKHLDVLPLLFQTGYLTITEYDPIRRRFTLSYPNREVEEAFTTYLLRGFTEIETAFGMSYLYKLVDALNAHDIPQFFTTLQTFFANIPYDLQVKQEKYYQTIFYLIFMMIGFQIEAEVKTNRGRIDTVLAVPDHIYLFEFKLDGTADDALTQIEQHEYAQKYQGDERPMTSIGATFDTQARNITDWKIGNGQ